MRRVRYGGATRTRNETERARPCHLDGPAFVWPGGLGFPHAQQAVRITRTTGGRPPGNLIATLPADTAQPDQLSDWARREWHIENRLHRVRDVTLAEDAHQARTGNGPAVAAVLRNTAIGYPRHQTRQPTPPRLDQRRDRHNENAMP